MAASCISFFERCRFKTGWTPLWPGSNVQTGALGPGYWRRRLIYGYKKFNKLLRRWEPIVFDPDSCSSNKGGFAFIALDSIGLPSINSIRRWRIQHKFENFAGGGAKCLIYDADDDSDTRGTFQGYPKFMRFRRRWGYKHAVGNSSEWRFGASVTPYGRYFQASDKHATHGAFGSAHVSAPLLTSNVDIVRQRIVSENRTTDKGS